ncbi:hypothetical protein GC194_01780 [bacterium]|nr:hypothetical protein [bacterium]
MKITAIRAVLWILIIILTYKIIDVVYQDIHFAKVKREKETARVEKMEKIRELQFVYRDEHRKFAKEWDALLKFARDGQITIVKTIGDPNDTTTQVQRDTTYKTVLDSLFKGKLATIDSLPFIPYSKAHKQFKLEADKINLRGVMVDVFQVTDTDPIFQDPEQTEANGPEEEPLQIGKMYTANYDLNRDPRLKK